MPNDKHDTVVVPDWWREEEATDRMMDAAREAQFESELDAHIADIHEWLDARYHDKYKQGQSLSLVPKKYS